MDVIAKALGIMLGDGSFGIAEVYNSIIKGSCEALKGLQRS